MTMLSPLCGQALPLVVLVLSVLAVVGQESYSIKYRASLIEPQEDANDGSSTPREGRRVSFKLDVPPGYDPLLALTEECDRHQLSEDSCSTIAQHFTDSGYMTTTKGAVSSLSHGDALSVLFGMRKSYETFGEAAQAAMSLENFHDVASWWRFQEMLGDAASREGWPDYEHFSEDPIFHFAMPWASWGDPEAARLAKVNSEVDAELLLETVGDAEYGFREGVLPNHLNGPLPTSNTCRHAMHFTALVRVLRERGLVKDGGLKHLSFVEIGGGFGNMARLAHTAYGCKSWTILDLDFMGQLQHKFLENTTRNVRIEANASPLVTANSGPDETVFNLVSTKRLNTWFSGGYGGSDVLIATSSLSELAMEDFWWYFNHIVPRVRLILYAYNKRWPSEEMHREKLAALMEAHNLVYTLESAGGVTVTAVFEKKNNSI